MAASEESRFEALWKTLPGGRRRYFDLLALGGKRGLTPEEAWFVTMTARRGLSLGGWRKTRLRRALPSIATSVALVLLALMFDQWFPLLGVVALGIGYPYRRYRLGQAIRENEATARPPISPTAPHATR